MPPLVGGALIPETFALKVLTQALADERVDRMLNEGVDAFNTHGSLGFGLQYPKGHTNRVSDIPSTCFAQGQRERVLDAVAARDRLQASKDLCQAAFKEAMRFSNANSVWVCVKQVIDQHGGESDCSLGTVEEIISRAEALRPGGFPAKF